MDKKGVILTVFLFALILLPLTSSAPPVQTNINVDQGLQIFFPDIQTVPVGFDANLTIHVANISSGKALLNDEVNCTLQGYDKFGDYLLVQNFTPHASIPTDLFIELAPGNFSEVGVMSWFIHCNTDGIGGSVQGLLTVNRVGTQLTSGESLLYTTSTVVVFLLFLICLYGAIAFPFRSKKKRGVGDGSVTDMIIPKTAYLKLGMILMTHSMFIWLMNLLIGVTDTYLSLTIFYGLAEGLMWIATAISLPLMILLVVVGIITAIKDIQIEAEVNKLLKIEGEYGKGK